MDTDFYSNMVTRSQGWMENGQRSGEWREWYRSGSRRKIGRYKEGHPEGLWTYWFENGVKQKEGSFQCGEATGKWIYWNDFGRESTTTTYPDVDCERIAQERANFSGWKVEATPACAKFPDHYTELMTAASFNLTPWLNRLLATKSVNEQGANGSTALMIAARKNHPNIVRDLLAAGADPAIKNCFGKTAADIAAEQGNDDIARLLHEAANAMTEGTAK